MKTCTRCKVAKPLEEFHKEKNTKDGRRSHCRACIKMANLEWQARDPEHARACWRKSYKKYYNAEYQHKKKLAAYRISQEDYDLMLNFKNGRCHICNETLATIPHIDHCHYTKQVRGMLCMKCNTAIGSMRDNPALMRKAADYVEACGFAFYRAAGVNSNITPS